MGGRSVRGAGGDEEQLAAAIIAAPESLAEIKKPTSQDQAKINEEPTNPRSA